MSHVQRTMKSKTILDSTKQFPSFPLHPKQQPKSLCSGEGQLGLSSFCYSQQKGSVCETSFSEDEARPIWNIPWQWTPVSLEPGTISESILSRLLVCSLEFMECASGIEDGGGSGNMWFLKLISGGCKGGGGDDRRERAQFELTWVEKQLSDEAATVLWNGWQAEASGTVWRKLNCFPSAP